jgi:hypothetical protein
MLMLEDLFGYVKVLVAVPKVLGVFIFIFVISPDLFIVLTVPLLLGKPVLRLSYILESSTENQGRKARL